MRARNIALTGFMAVGKSVVGRKLARRLGWRLVDVDRAIEEEQGMKVQEIFEREGEAYFRKLEKRKLGEILSEENQVIATGGGAVVDEENLRLLKQKSFLVCLTASPETLLKRSGSGKDRPLLKGSDKRERIEALLSRRKDRYAQAHLCIDTESRAVDQVVEEILKTIHRRTAPSPLPSPSGRGLS
jgi:shikimate kinase